MKQFSSDDSFDWKQTNSEEQKTSIEYFWKVPIIHWEAPP